ncbi:predicted protein [Sclerotinia sclerotiorum 1980 UF-70]|uniref:Uncharacterized protein n=1 Tax=Sclerotinia sclerotiorum (strain ATCC 18683 / 1980 / Ss-1) TaxID=665079 RepID=A7FA22_SCLS1|nr:predicted protein [Sclerotinia sclerotiorum 1980 UF-70]EDO00583.1 predicted protein [Sclerotinia sclerotiorum 1980 UF-70]
MSSSSRSPQTEIAQSIFLRLPLELRRMIYKLLFRRKQLDITKFTALDVLYGESKFHVRIEAGSLPELSVKIGVTNLSRIRHLHIFACSREPYRSLVPPCRRGWKLDSHQWKCLLGNILQLILHVQQPDMCMSYPVSKLYNERDIPRWIAFLDMFLPFVTCSIDKDTKILILEDGWCLTARHVAKYFRPIPKNLRIYTFRIMECFNFASAANGMERWFGFYADGGMLAFISNGVL